MRVTFDQIDITPTNPEYFSGYGRSEKSQGIHDALIISYLKIALEATNLFIFSLDLLNVNRSFSTKVEEKINELYPKNENIVLISAIHTHSGPAVFTLPSLDHAVNPELEEEVYRKVIQLLSNSCVSSEVSRIELVTGEIEGAYGNRNDPEAYGDKNFYRFDFFQEEKLVGAVVNIACHPTILKQDNLLFSADLFGSVRSDLENVLDCPVLMLNGASGDSSSRYYSKGNDFKEVERLATEISQQILNKGKRQTVEFSLSSHSIFKENIHYNPQADSFWVEKSKALSEEKNSAIEKVLATHLVKKMNPESHWVTLISQQLIFKQFVILTYSGEVTSAFAKNIRNRFDCPVIIVGYENDYVSYLVEEENYGKYFESYLTRLPKGAADRFIEKTIRVIG